MRGIVLTITIVLVIINNTSQNFDLQTPINISNFENFNPQFKDIETAFKNKCVQNGAREQTYNTLAVSTIITTIINYSSNSKINPANQPLELNSCLEKFLNYTKIQIEMEESKAVGKMDEVFVKYCNKYPQIYECVKNTSDVLRHCLSFKEQEVLDQGLQFLGVMKDYMCFKDGIRFSLFITQGGLECYESRTEKVQQCLSNTTGGNFLTDPVNILPDFLLHFNGSTICSDLFTVRVCVYQELNKCKHNIPANVIEALFKFLMKKLSCETPLQYRHSQTDDIWIRAAGVTVFLLIVALISYKLARS